MHFPRTVIDHVKNIGGFKTDRKIVVFLVDDYGNVRVDSMKAWERMEKAGLKMQSRFDCFDTLETREDLEMLLEILDSFRDATGRPAIFTPFAVPCNIDFERLEAEGYQSYLYETLPFTFGKLATYQPSAYQGAWELWQEAVEKGYLIPQFHGREHLNLKVFNEKLALNDNELMISLKNRSFTGISDSGYSTISYTAAFDFWDFSETGIFANIISEGLDDFEKVFGRKAVHYNAPGSSDHHVSYRGLKSKGIRYIDTPWIKKEHQGSGKYQRSLNVTGQNTPEGLIKIVRNVVFEPGVTIPGIWVNYALKQVDAAFRMKKPAVISSHRVNFCGHIDPENRQRGLESLKNLIGAILKKHPETEFMSSDELGRLVERAL